MAQKIHGIEIFHGPSEINGENIVAIATGIDKNSKNPKTGPMIQVYILCDDQNPIDAAQSGDDDRICGNCKHRGGSCYVNIAQGPYAIYNAWLNGKYTKVKQSHLDLFKNQKIRWGSYGEPTAIPFGIVKSINKVCVGHTSYTHRWKDCDQRHKQYTMASVDTYEEYKLAKEMGWRTFRTKHDSFDLLNDEIECPASKESGHKTTCDKCLLCSGLTKENKPSVAIVAHGSPIKLRIYDKLFPKTK